MTKINFKEIARNQTIRVKLSWESMSYFFGIYLNRYIKKELAPFHFEFFKLAENETIKLLVILAFRESGKSTFFSTCYPIWAVTGKPQKKFVLIFTQTQLQAKLLLDNIKRELETNPTLKADIGPFETPNDEWSSISIVLRRFNARIMVGSTEQGVRGLRYGEFRPDLIILDDVEDLASIKTQEQRNKLFNWYTGDIRPLSADAKIVIVGTRLDPDDLYSRIIKKIQGKQLKGVYKIYPIVNSDGKPAWPGKYPDIKIIEELRSTYIDEAAFQRECMLKFIPENFQLIFPGWISYYDVLPSFKSEDFNYAVMGVDLAISDKELADYTAIISAMVFGNGDNLKIYILPNPINEHLNFPNALEKIKSLFTTLKMYGVKLFIEDNGFQKAYLEQLYKEGYYAEGLKIYGKDKRSRLALTTPLIHNGQVLFPKKGAEELIRQMTNFGLEKHDDLVDAFAIMILKIIEAQNDPEPEMFIL